MIVVYTLEYMERFYPIVKGLLEVGRGVATLADLAFTPMVVRVARGDKLDYLGHGFMVRAMFPLVGLVLGLIGKDADPSYLGVTPPETVLLMGKIFAASGWLLAGVAVDAILTGLYRLGQQDK